MRIAILGATSQIAKDMILALADDPTNQLALFARRTDAVAQWKNQVSLRQDHGIYDFATFGSHQLFDAIINFVGSGNPALTASMGTSIFDVTYKFDQLAIDYLHHHPNCRYLFMSSGAAYCSTFEYPADESTKTTISINDFQSTDWYAVAKLYAECRHRALKNHAIFDIRIFNYFSRTSDLSARFLITDILRAIEEKTIFKTSSTNIWRDYIGHDELYQLIKLALRSPPANDVVDCFSKSPLDKHSLLQYMQLNFDLRYELQSSHTGVNATGFKEKYFSVNKRASKYGYKPQKTSLEIILQEVGAISTNLQK
jgi:nucleoside-diphosphate-sugar epimerase